MLNLVSDSSCDLRAFELSGPQVRLQVIPMHLHIDHKDFPDDENLNLREMLEAMAKAPSSTACPSPQAFADAFAQEKESICVTISSPLSGTYQAAVTGRELALAEDPERKIFVLDSRSTAGGMALLLRKAAALYEAGRPFEEICDILTTYRDNLRTCFTLMSFHNLVQAGRMKPITGALLQTLGIHVIAQATPEGSISVAGKARGEVKTYQAIVEQMKKSKNCRGAEVIVSHCENLVGAVRLKEHILKELPVRSVEIRSCRGLTGYYAMEGGLILAY